MNTLPAIRRFAMAFAILFAFFYACPSPLPFLATAAIDTWADVVDADYRFDSYAVSRGRVQAHARTATLTHFSVNGAPGPEMDFDATMDARVLNLYPVIAFALLFAFPARRRRDQARAIIACAVLVAVAATFDLYVANQMQHARTLQGLLSGILPGLYATPENMAARDALLAWLERVKTLQAFLNTGGRLFLAILAALVCGAARSLARRTVVRARPARLSRTSRADPSTARSGIPRRRSGSTAARPCSCPGAGGCGP
jgi:hypothetical protein